MINNLNNNDSKSSGACLSICSCDPSQSRHAGCCDLSCTISPNSKVFDANTVYNYSESIPQACKSVSMVDQGWLFSRYQTNSSGLRDEEQLPAMLKWGRIKGKCQVDFNSHSKSCNSDNYCLIQLGSGHFCLCGAPGAAYYQHICEGDLICNTTSGYNCSQCPFHNCQDPDQGLGSISKPFGKISRTTLIVTGYIFGGLGVLFLTIVTWTLYIFVKRRREMKLKQNFFKRNGGLLLQQELSSNEGDLICNTTSGYNCSQCPFHNYQDPSATDQGSCSISKPFGKISRTTLIVTTEKDSFFGKSTSCDPDYIDIDSDQTDPLLCGPYAVDIYSNMHVAELNRRPFPSFMESVQRDITQTMRGILVDWLVEVSEEYKLVPDTLYMTVYLIDWFLSQNYIERQRLQLLGITCMLIASKYEEICAPRVEEFCFITDNTYSREEVLKMESQVLKCFGFQLYAPTTKTFLRRFLRAAQASYKSPSLELEYLANFLAELMLVDYGFLNFFPSIIAASAVLLARWTLDQSSHPWNATLEHYTSYRASDLKVPVFALQDLQSNTNGCPLNAVRMKYRQQKFKSVAALSSPVLLETLF